MIDDGQLQSLIEAAVAARQRAYCPYSKYAVGAALLTEMFPAQIRYSSMSIPYHIGAGYLGGFLPLISSIIVARRRRAAKRNPAGRRE